MAIIFRAKANSKMPKKMCTSSENMETTGPIACSSIIPFLFTLVQRLFLKPIHCFQTVWYSQECNTGLETEPYRIQESTPDDLNSPPMFPTLSYQYSFHICHENVLLTLANLFCINQIVFIKVLNAACLQLLCNSFAILYPM